MRRLYVWLLMIAGTLPYCAVVPGYMTVNEFAAAVYFSGMALLWHWASEMLCAAVPATEGDAT